MTPVLIVIKPYKVGPNERREVFVGSAGSPAELGLDGKNWHAAIDQRPVLSLELMNPNLNGRVQAGTCRFTIDLNGLVDSTGESVYTAAMKWTGAEVEARFVNDAVYPAEPHFKGRIETPRMDLDSGILSIIATVSTEFLTGNLLTEEFNGDNAAGGEPEVRGTLRPAGFGPCENIPPVWFDTTRWIGQIDGYGNTVSIDRLMEGLADRGTAVQDYADYAALAAAIDAGDIIPGRWATCVAEGLIGLGAPPEYPITVNATFGFNRIGEVISRVLQTHLGVNAADIDAAAFTALNAAVPYDVCYWTNQQRDARDLIERLAGSCNATPIVGFDGKVTITRAVTSTPVGTLDRSGNQIPRVTDWQTANPNDLPWRIAARVARPASTLAFSDVLYEDEIIDRGLYDAGTDYRQGNTVSSLDKSTWLYINATPGSNNPPPTWPTTSNAHWQNLSPPVDATSLGVEPGATVGAQTGVNLLDGGSQVLSDPDIGNVNITIGADGTLSGAGGGQVTISGIGYVGDLGATSSENLIVNGELLSADTSMFALGANVTIVGLASTDPGARAFRFSTGGNGQAFFGQGATTSIASPTGTLIAAQGGQKLYCAALIRNNSDNGLNPLFRFRYAKFAADEDYGGTEQSGYFNPAFADEWVWATHVFDIPDETDDLKPMAIARPFLEKIGTNCEVDVAKIIYSRSEIGSDVTDTNPKVVSIDPGARTSENLISDPRMEGGVLRMTNTPTRLSDEDINYADLAIGVSNFIIDESGVQSATNGMPIEPGKTYQFTAQLRSDGERVRLRVRPRGTSTGAVSYLYDAGGAGLDTSGAWQEFTFAYTVPAGNHSHIEFGVDYIDLAGGTFAQVRLPRISEIEPAATDGATIGDNLLGGSGVVSEPDILNVQVTIGADGTLAGAGGGQVTYGGLGGGALGLLATLDLANLGLTTGLLPPTRADNALVNSQVTIGADGSLAGAGGGQVTISGLGYIGDLNATRNTSFFSTLDVLDLSDTLRTTQELPTTRAAAGLINSNVTISSNGSLSGGGGGQVTIGGLGYTGALNATFNDGALADLDAIDLSDTLLTSGLLPTNRAASGLVNTNVTIGANGTLSGGGGGQVTISGLGYLGSLNATAGSATIGLRINSTTTGSSNPGEAALNGYDSDGVLQNSVDGYVIIDGQQVTIERNQTSTFTILTGVANQSGYIVFDAAKTNPFTVNGAAIDVAFAWNDAGQWKYDNNGSSVNFTPTDDMYAVGWLRTAAGDNIAAGGVTPSPIPLSAIGSFAQLDAVNLADTAFTSGLLPTSRAATGLVNTNVSIGANGTLSGGGGGQVTILGLGFVGELDADLTAFGVGPTNEVFKFESDGLTAEMGEFPRTLVYKINDLSGTIESGVTWDYLVLSGTFNGHSASSTYRTTGVTGTGVANLSANSLGSNTAEIQMRGVVGTKTVLINTTMQKDVAEPNQGGGGGGTPNLATQSSGFTAIQGDDTTYTVISNELQVTAGTTTQEVTVNLSSQISGGALISATLQMQLQRWNGSSWVNFGSAVSKTTTYEYDFELDEVFATPAVFQFTETITVTSGSDQRTRVQLRVSSAGGNQFQTIATTGSLQLEA